ncbi:aminopeptidase N [Phascolarctos cinereus]|uniref:Aminopeptidase n=1 Tax=Phascolarctos cinereus TaxID=38626 RepID=A0A6P5II88_PHACI|nr:aminopeptidase N [Phascolarctos cinereus]XP_020820824.1 aminopeptidase N [Phascolarctos cinereus]XP_020820833.1 aminopeptidase N [Phascolarctos cinereus]XP_020820843.1 aminopeptidase N [Phascolarctos cinereus]
MAKGFFISKTLGIVGILFAVAAICTIITLSVLYSEEKNNNKQRLEKPTSQIPDTEATPAATAPTTLDPSLAWNRYRLPKSLIPDHYTVKLRPNLTTDDRGLYIFWGESTVRFLCKEETDVIIIHSNKLNYTMKDGYHVSLKGVNGSQPPQIDSTELVTTTQYLVVHLQSKLVVGHHYEMESTFVGELADDLAGFYRSEYTEDGVNKVLATTQMEAPYARKSFPCFDEPGMKATFDITLIHPSDHIAISNMPVKSSVKQDDNWNITQFDTTPRMSTYLLAYIVCQFEAAEEQGRDVQIRIWARPQAIEAGHGQYALNITGPILDFFADHYNTPYPLPKSDQVGLPDFSAGAMENWGLVTYRENSLLFDELSSSISNKERVVTVIAHELAHQWFGNLVTVEWWNDLWLNEGFASYVEYLGADFAEPSWNLKDLIVLNDVHQVMAIDALASSHPLSTPEDEINTPAQISELFDTITYSKGASVLRMLSSFLTEDLFKTGLSSYLHTFSYNNTVYQNLWDHLQQAVDRQTAVQLPVSVQEIMDRWILQMGFPVLKLDTTTGVLSQQHFLLDPTSNVTRSSQFNYQWIVPISATKKEGGSYSGWLSGDESAVYDQLKVTNDNDWVLLNINMTGYYLVNYDDRNWKQLQNELQTNLASIPVINRAQIIHDGFNLARAQHIPTTLALENTLFLENEVEYMPWEAALSSLSYFQLMFDRSEVYGPMKNYLKRLVTPLFEHFKSLTNNWADRPPTLTEQYNEINAISTACSNGIVECGDLASNLFKQWMNDPSNNPIHPNLRSTIYCNAIARGGEEEWEFAWNQFLNATLVTEADKLRSGMACSKEVWILQRYLSYALDPTLIRKQDATSTIISICRNVIGQSLTWDFIRANWKKLFEDYGGGSFSFSSLIQGVTQRFSTEFELQQLEQFEQDNMDVGFGSGTRALEQALEKTRSNINWVNENKELVLVWFNEHSN